MKRVALGVEAPIRPGQGVCYIPAVAYQALLDEARALPEDQRAALVQALSATLGPPGVEEAWAREVARRVEFYRLVFASQGHPVTE